MASQILANVANVAEKAKDMTGAKSQKVADLAANTKDVHDKSWRITSDYGVKQNNTDDWLKVASEDKQGPMLLEDHFAREKVCSEGTLCHGMTDSACRSIVSTTSVFQNVSCTLAARALLASSRSSNLHPMSPPRASLRTRLARRPSSCAFRPCLAAVALLTQSAMCVVLRANSTPRRVIGILWGTISRSSSSRTR